MGLRESSEKLPSSPEAPLQGELSSDSETERLYGGEPDREPQRNETSPSRLRRATSPIEGRPWHTGKFCLYPESFPLRQRLPYKGSWRGACDETERLYEGQPARAPPPSPRSSTRRVSSYYVQLFRNVIYYKSSGLSRNERKEQVKQWQQISHNNSALCVIPISKSSSAA